MGRPHMPADVAAWDADISFSSRATKFSGLALGSRPSGPGCLIDCAITGSRRQRQG
jgi:hypothetical protein